jgi:hypothetical protein
LKHTPTFEGAECSSARREQIASEIRSFASSLTHVVGTTSLDDCSLKLLLIKLLLSGGVSLKGKVTDDVLHVALLDGQLSTSQRLDLLAAPSEEDKLGTLAFLVTSGEADEGKQHLVVRELALELRETTRSGTLDLNLVGASRETEQSPARDKSARVNKFESTKNTSSCRSYHCGPPGRQ